MVKQEDQRAIREALASRRRIRKGPNAKNSCIHCKKAHKACSTTKPCDRCQKKGLKCVVEGMTTTSPPPPSSNQKQQKEAKLENMNYHYTNNAVTPQTQLQNNYYPTNTDHHAIHSNIHRGPIPNTTNNANIPRTIQHVGHSGGHQIEGSRTPAGGINYGASLYPNRNVPTHYVPNTNQSKTGSPNVTTKSHQTEQSYMHSNANMHPSLKMELDRYRRLLAEKDARISRLLTICKRNNPFAVNYSNPNMPCAIFRCDGVRKVYSLVSCNKAFHNQAMEYRPYAKTHERDVLPRPEEVTYQDCGLLFFNFDPENEERAAFERDLNQQTITELLKIATPGITWTRKCRFATKVYTQRFYYDSGLIFASYEGPHPYFDDEISILQYRFAPTFSKDASIYLTIPEAEKCFTRLWESFRSVMPEFFSCLSHDVPTIPPTPTYGNYMNRSGYGH